MPKQILFRSTLSALIVSSPGRGTRIERRQQVLVHAFDGSDLLIRELGELFCPRPLREAPGVLSQESHHQVERRIWKIEERFDAALGLIVSLQIVNLARKRIADGFHDAAGEELCLPRRVEKAVEIARFVETRTLSDGVVSHR